MDKIRQEPFALIEVYYGVAVPRMLREETTEVLVAGAGPVGMITAILLADNGIRVKVVDKESGTATHSYSCALHPASLQLLAEMGFAEEILNMGRRVETVGFYDGKRRRADAAHQTGPVGMQSMNVGIREAAELVGHVKKILREHGSSDLLTAYACGRREEWQQLLGTKGELKPWIQTDPWIRERGARFLSCLPASGEHLRQLFDQIGLDLR